MRLFFYVVLMVSGGACATIVAKMMGKDLVPQRHSIMETEEFSHPLVMALIMFTGEAIFLIILGIRRCFLIQSDDG